MPITVKGLPTIPGVVVKEFLDRHGITQRSIAEKMSTEPDSSAMSHWLADRHDPSNEHAVALLAQIVNRAHNLANGFVNSNDTAVAKTAASFKGLSGPAKVARVGQFMSQGKDPVTGHKLTDHLPDPKTSGQTKKSTPTTTIDTTKSDWVKNALSAFPEKEWYKIIQGARKAKNEGLVLTSVGPRLSINTHQTYLSLIHDGFEPKDAFLMAYRHVLLDRLVSSDREFMQNLFFTHMGEKFRDKVIKHPQLKKDEPDYYPYIRTYIRFGIIPWLFSAPGSGKTTTMIKLAEEMDREFVRVPCSKYLTPEEVFAGLEASGGTTYPKDGMITAAIRRVVEGKSPGCIINLDEFSRLQTGLSTTFHSMMEMNELVVPLTGERLAFDRLKVAVTVTDNTMGLAEEAQHAGAEPVDEATRDRCVFVRTDYPDLKVEKSFVAKSLDFFPTTKVAP